MFCFAAHQWNQELPSTSEQCCLAEPAEHVGRQFTQKTTIPSQFGEYFFFNCFGSFLLSWPHLNENLNTLLHNVPLCADINRRGYIIDEYFLPLGEI